MILETEMDAVSRGVKVQLPNYLRSLPIPSTFGGFLKLSGGEWVQLVPLVVTTSVAVYLVVSALIPSKPKKKEHEWLNKTIEKEKEKVADTFQIEDLGDKMVFCRCWKSKKVSTSTITRGKVAVRSDAKPFDLQGPSLGHGNRWGRGGKSAFKIV